MDSHPKLQYVMTGFAFAACLNEDRHVRNQTKIDMSEAIAVAAFTHCLAPNGLPRSETAGEPKRTCQILTLSIIWHLLQTLSLTPQLGRKNSRSRLRVSQPVEKCRINGTASVRSFAAKGRALDIRLEPAMQKLRASIGEASHQCLESVRNNSVSHCILTEEQRRHHAEEHTMARKG
jgi:hypothetical protein